MPAAARKNRLFFSYGREDNIPLLLRVKDDLAADGYEIWHDMDRIAGGDVFAAEIEDGIRWADVMIAFMGPHSIRRANDPDSKDGRDSICHRELSMADAVKQQGRIVPIMAAACTPPLMLQGLDYVDMTDCLRDADKYSKALEKLRSSLEDALEGKVRYRAWYAGLRPLDFRGVIREKIEGFYGRQWLFRRIDAWRDSGATQSLLIFGDPGIGKSAVAAKLIGDNPQGRVTGYFFCQHNEQITLNPGRMVQTLAAQLAASFPAYRAKLDDPPVMERLTEAERDSGAAWTKGVLTPLGRIDHPKTDVRYLVVDALDEALEWDGSPNIVGVLSQGLRQMPPWLRLIATARNEPAVMDRLRGLQFEPLDAGTMDNRTDIEGYIRARLHHFPSVSERTIATLQEKSAGNFLYVNLTLDDIEAGHLRLDELNRLSPGLGGRYLDFFERHFPKEADYAGVRRVLEVMAAAVEPLRESQIAAATGLDQEETLPKLRRLLSQFFQRAERGADPLYVFYHKSITDWLIDDERRGADFSIHPAKGHRQLADWGWREYALGRAKWSPYLVAHLPMHLLAAGRWDNLARLLLDPHYLEAKTETGLVLELAGDLDSAGGKEGLPEEHPDRPRLLLIGEAIRRDLDFLAGHPTTLFQCLWNLGWWYDCPQAGPHYVEGWSPGQKVGAGLHRWLEEWRTARERADQGFVWLRSLRPPSTHLGTGANVVLQGNDATVRCLAFSPDGRRLVSGSDDKTVRVWDADSGIQLHCLRGHSRGLECVAFSPGGRHLVSGSEDKTVRVWNADSGAELFCIHDCKLAFNGVAFSPDGRRLACALHNDCVQVWDVASGVEIHTFHTSYSPLCVAFSPDGGRLVGGGMFGVGMCDLANGSQIHCLDSLDCVWSVAFSPDGRRVVCGTDQRVLVLESANFAEPHYLRRQDKDTWFGLVDYQCLNEGEVLKVAYSPDGQRIVATDGVAVRVWDAESGSCMSVTGRGDVVAIAAGPPQFLWRAVSPVHLRETAIIESAMTGEPVTWFPNALFLIATHPSGRTWAGCFANHFCLFTLEGKV